MKSSPVKMEAYLTIIIFKIQDNSFQLFKLKHFFEQVFIILEPLQKVTQF